MRDPKFISLLLIVSFLVAVSFFVLLYNLRNPRIGYRYSYDESYQTYFSILMGCVIFLLVLGFSLFISRQSESNRK